MTEPGSTSQPKAGAPAARSPPRLQAIPAQNALLGIGLMLLGVLLFVFNDVLGKWLVATYSVGQVLLVRSFAGLLMLAPAIWRSGWGRLLHPPQPGLLALRAVLSTLETAAFYWCVAYLPLADVVTFYMATPVFVTVLAWRLLGEGMDWPRALAIVAGLGGVILAMRPATSTLSLPVLAAVAGSLVFSASVVATRALRGTSDIALVTWQMAAALALGVVSAPFAWVQPSWRDLMLLAMLGIVATLAHMAVNRSLRVAPASIVIPYQYSQIVWTVLMGVAVFGDWPDAMMLAGSAVIIVAGAVILWRERGVAASEDIR